MPGPAAGDALCSAGVFVDSGIGTPLLARNARAAVGVFLADRDVDLPRRLLSDALPVDRILALGGQVRVERARTLGLFRVVARAARRDQVRRGRRLRVLRVAAALPALDVVDREPTAAL